MYFGILYPRYMFLYGDSVIYIQISHNQPN